MLDRLRSMNPRRRDGLIAAVALVEFQAEIGLSGAGSADERLVAHAGMAVLAGAVALRSRFPATSTAIAMTVFAVMTSSLGPAINNSITMPFLALFGLMFSMAALRDGPAVVAAAVYAAVCMMVSIASDGQPDTAGDAVFGAVILLGAPLSAGRILRSRMELARALREKAARAEAEREIAAAAAAVEERTRIAGELHDVVSHALSAMVVQAGGARRLAARDPARAREAFAAIEASGREALTEMRSLLGVLRREDEELALAPQPSLAHLRDLVRRSAASGLPADLVVHGEPRPVPPGADLIAYRVVQDALNGALDSGTAGHAVVEVRYLDGAVELAIDDDGEGVRRLLGVRERLALYGGQLVAGQRRGGGHSVHARVPIGDGA